MLSYTHSSGSCYLPASHWRRYKSVCKTMQRLRMHYCLACRAKSEVALGAVEVPADVNMDVC